MLFIVFLSPFVSFVYSISKIVTLWIFAFQKSRPNPGRQWIVEERPRSRSQRYIWRHFSSAWEKRKGYLFYIMYQYPHVSQLFILTSVAKPGIPGAIKNGWVCTADYRMLLGTAVRPVPARMPYISRLCDVGATDVKRWWWWWWMREKVRINVVVESF